MKKTKTKINKKKLDIVMIKTCILLTAVFFSHYAIYQAGNEAVTGQGEDYSTINHNHIMQLFEERREAHRAENAKLDQYDDILSTLGTMGQEIKKASIEFGVDNDEALLLMGLSIGIANAESTLGTNFVIDYDVNCFNWWGIKKKRVDGSWLRCFNDGGGSSQRSAVIFSNSSEYPFSASSSTISSICSFWSSDIACHRSSGTSHSSRISITAFSAVLFVFISSTKTVPCTVQVWFCDLLY